MRKNKFSGSDEWWSVHNNEVERWSIINDGLKFRSEIWFLNEGMNGWGIWWELGPKWEGWPAKFVLSFEVQNSLFSQQCIGGREIWINGSIKNCNFLFLFIKVFAISWVMCRITYGCVLHMCMCGEKQITVLVCLSPKCTLDCELVHFFIFTEHVCCWYFIVLLFLFYIYGSRKESVSPWSIERGLWGLLIVIGLCLEHYW